MNAISHISNSQFVQPIAVLIYEDEFTEGLIFPSCKKDIIVDYYNLEEFENDYCTDCELYISEGEDDNDTDEIEELVEDLISETMNTGLTEYERTFAVDKLNAAREYYLDVKDVINALELANANLYDFIIDPLQNFVDSYSSRTCNGGVSILREGKCKHLYSDFQDIRSYTLHLPSHIWLKTNNYGNLRYSLFALIERGMYIMPPLSIGNVHQNGSICWGDILPSSNIKTAYEEFFSSIFNQDLGGYPFEDGTDFCSDLMAQLDKWVKSGATDNSLINNLLLTNGVFKSGVQIYKL